jgi:HK97 family phage portal protein
MGLIQAASGRYRTTDINDERLWSSYVPLSAAGVPVTTDSALRISTVWGCVRLISQSLASIPLIVYRNVGEDGRERARQHPLYGLLHEQPNAQHTAFEFKRLMTTYALLRGNGLAFIRPGARGMVDRLEPIHPDRYRPPQLVDGQLRYPILGPNGQPEYFLQDEIFHLCGLSYDGYWGVSVVEYARETMGLSMATESYAARYFSQNATPAGVLVHPGRVDRAGREKIRAEWEADMAGLGNAHRTAVVAENIEYKPVGLSAQDSQFLETRQFQVADVARWFGVDLTLLQENTKATSWGTGIEAMLLAFKTFTLLPWAKLWEGAISRDLILAPQAYFAEFLFDALVRPDLLTRYQAYDVAVKGGWKSRNEIRRLENDNPVAGLDGYDRPLNMGEARSTTGSQNGNAHYGRVLQEAAERVLRKELAALGKAAARLGNDRDAWTTAVREFYGGHGHYVQQTLCVNDDAADAWVGDQLADVLALGPGVAQAPHWAADRARRLAERAALAAG